METLISIVIVSLFFSILLVKKWQIGRLWNRIRKKPRSKFVKPFDCLPCMTWWVTIPVCVGHFVLFNGFTSPTITELHTLFVSSCAAFVAAALINNQ